MFTRVSLTGNSDSRVSGRRCEHYIALRALFTFPSRVRWFKCERSLMHVGLFEIIFYRHFWMWTPHLFVRAQTHIFLVRLSQCIQHCSFPMWGTPQGLKVKRMCVPHFSVFISISFVMSLSDGPSITSGHVFTYMFCVKTLSVLNFIG